MSQLVVTTNDDSNPANETPFFKALAIADCLFFPFGVSFMEMSLWIAVFCDEFVSKIRCLTFFIILDGRTCEILWSLLKKVFVSHEKPKQILFHI